MKNIKVEAVGGDFKFLVVTVKTGSWSGPFRDYCERIGDTIKRGYPDLEGKLLIVPDTITFESLNSFGIIEKLVEICPETIGLLATPDSG